MIVGISGLESSGKSAVAARLRDKHGFVILSPSNPLKLFARDLLGFTEEQLWGSSSNRNAVHPTLKNGRGEPLVLREFLDTMGMAVREACPMALVDASLDGLKAKYDYVNESCRFKNELDAIRARGGYLIRRKGGRPNGLRTDAEMADIPDAYFDAVISRMDTLEQLHQVVDTLIWSWTAKESA